MKLKQDQIQMTHSEDWPLHLTLEQREQLLSGKIARAVAALKGRTQTTSKNVVHNQSANSRRDTGLKL